MKLRNIKFILLAALFLTASALPIDTQAQQLKEPFAQSQEFKAQLPESPAGISAPSHAPPPGGGGDANREELPVTGSLRILICLACVYGVIYGVACRRKRDGQTDAD